MMPVNRDSYDKPSFLSGVSSWPDNQGQFLKIKIKSLNTWLLTAGQSASPVQSWHPVIRIITVLINLSPGILEASKSWINNWLSMDKSSIREHTWKLISSKLPSNIEHALYPPLDSKMCFRICRPKASRKKWTSNVGSIWYYQGSYSTLSSCTCNNLGWELTLSECSTNHINDGGVWL